MAGITPTGIRLRPTTRRLLLECLHGERLRRTERGETPLPQIDSIIGEALLTYRHYLGNQLKQLGISWDDVRQEVELDRRQRRTPPTAETSNVIDDDE